MADLLLFISKDGAGYRSDLLLAGSAASTQLKAARVSFDVTSASTSVEQLKALRIAWDGYLQDYNLRAPLQASTAWHTSELWIPLAGHEIALGDVWRCQSLSLGLVLFIVVFVYFRQLRLVLAIAICQISTLHLQALFLTCILGWPVGVLEIIGLVLFGGQSLALHLHATSAYCGPPPRTEDTAPQDEKPRLEAEGEKSLDQQKISAEQEEAAMRAAAEKEEIPRRQALATAIAVERLARTQRAVRASLPGLAKSACLVLVTLLPGVLPLGLRPRARVVGAALAISWIAVLHALLLLPVLMMIFGPASVEEWPLLERCCRSRATDYSNKDESENQKDEDAKEIAKDWEEREERRRPRQRQLMISAGSLGQGPSSSGLVVATGDSILLRGGKTGRPVKQKNPGDERGRSPRDIAGDSRSTRPQFSASPRPAGQSSSASPRPAGQSSSASPRPAGQSSSASPRPAGQSSSASPRPAGRSSGSASTRPAGQSGGSASPRPAAPPPPRVASPLPPSAAAPDLASRPGPPAPPSLPSAETRRR